MEDYFKIVFPVITLLLGILINKYLDKQVRKKQIKKSGKRWIAELHSLEFPLRDQIESLNDYYSRLYNGPDLAPELIIYSTLNGDNFKMLDKNYLLEYLENKHKKMNLNDIISMSNYIHGYISINIGIYEVLKDHFNGYNKELDTSIRNFNSTLQSFLKAFNSYAILIEKDGNPLNDERFVPVANLFAKHILPNIDDSKFDPFQLEKDVFKPMLLILNKYRLQDITLELISAIRDCCTGIKQIALEKEKMLGIVLSIKDFYQEQYSKLHDVISRI